MAKGQRGAQRGPENPRAAASPARPVPVSWASSLRAEGSAPRRGRVILFFIVSSLSQISLLKWILFVIKENRSNKHHLQTHLQAQRSLSPGHTVGEPWVPCSLSWLPWLSAQGPPQEPQPRPCPTDPVMVCRPRGASVCPMPRSPGPVETTSWTQGGCHVLWLWSLCPQRRLAH